MHCFGIGGDGKPLASENVKKLHVKGINYLKLPFLCNYDSSLMPLSKFSFQIYIQNYHNSEKCQGHAHKFLRP